jgi:hypothetical protein
MVKAEVEMARAALVIVPYFSIRRPLSVKFGSDTMFLFSKSYVVTSNHIDNKKITAALCLHPRCALWAAKQPSI